MTEEPTFLIQGHEVTKTVDGIYEQQEIRYSCVDCDLENVKRSVLRDEDCVVRRRQDEGPDDWYPLLGDFDPEENDHPNLEHKLGNGIEVRSRPGGGVVRYALYELNGDMEPVQVSGEIGPLNDDKFIWWAEGYLQGKKNWGP